MNIQCFWLEETGRARRYLRRFASRRGDDIPSDEPCPVNGYHNEMVAIDEVPVGRKPWKYDEEYIVRDYGGADNLEAFKGDARWPAACACGYTFLDTDSWQVFFNDVMRRTDTGEEMTLRDAPAGAMWDAWWYGDSGFPMPPRPDGIHLMCRTPDGDWYVDGLAGNGPKNDYGWSRTGDPRAHPPTVTASPSIQIGGIGSGAYHGWLRNGVLVPA